MKLREHIDAFRLYLSDATNRPSDDITYPNKQIGYEITGAINSIAQTLDKKELRLIAPIICVKMEEVDIVECPCAPASGCTYMKSVNDIPDLLLLPSVSFADSGTDYTYIEWSRFRHTVNSRMKGTREGRYYTFKKIGDKQHLYVYHLKNVTNMSTVQVSGIPLDPIKWANTDCNAKDSICNPMDVQIVIPDKYHSQIFQIVGQKIGAIKALQGGADVLNDDAADNRK